MHPSSRYLGVKLLSCVIQFEYTPLVVGVRGMEESDEHDEHDEHDYEDDENRRVFVTMQHVVPWLLFLAFFHDDGSNKVISFLF